MIRTYPLQHSINKLVVRKLLLDFLYKFFTKTTLQKVSQFYTKLKNYKILFI
jgi:hypothetical protein